MAFPTRDSLQRTWVQLSSAASSLKKHCLEFNTASLAGPVSASAIESVFTRMGEFRTYASSVAATPGLAAYVQAQYSDAQLDIAAEYTAMLAQIDSALGWIAANIPTSGGYVLLDQWATNGAISRRSFSTASLAGLRNALASVAANIE